MIFQKDISADDARKLIQREEDHFFDHKSKDVSGEITENFCGFC